MKLIVITIIFIALFLLYRIAYPRQSGKKKENKIPEKKPEFTSDVMGKSRFVPPDRSKPLQTPATTPETEKRDEKPYIFAAKTEEKRSAEIPAEQLDEVFAYDSNPEIMSIPLETEEESETETEIDFEAEEAEELRRALGQEATMADGIDYDDLQNAVKVVKSQPNLISEETGRTLAQLENTDMFEKLVSGDGGKMNWIKGVVDRCIQNMLPQMEDTFSGTEDYGNFDVADFL